MNQKVITNKVVKFVLSFNIYEFIIHTKFPEIKKLIQINTDLKPIVLDLNSICTDHFIKKTGKGKALANSYLKEHKTFELSISNDLNYVISLKICLLAPSVSSLYIRI